MNLKAFALDVEREGATIPLRDALGLVRLLLRSQGIGAGTSVTTSGELQVFNLIRSSTPTLFDVGGHIGDYTTAFLKTFPNGRSFFFEPSSVHMAVAQRNLTGNVQFFEVALARSEGRAALYKNAEISGLASLTKRRLDHFGIRMDRSEAVQCRTLDHIVEETAIKRIDLLKIDVEGHELDVLNSGRRSLERGLVHMIQFEFGGCNLDTRTTLQDFFYFFRDFGYAIHLIKPSEGLVPLGGYQEIYEQYVTTNYLAVKQI
jgi:FkbM family methyltransferase